MDGIEGFVGGRQLAISLHVCARHLTQERGDSQPAGDCRPSLYTSERALLESRPFTPPFSHKRYHEILVLAHFLGCGPLFKLCRRHGRRTDGEHLQSPRNGDRDRIDAESSLDRCENSPRSEKLYDCGCHRHRPNENHAGEKARGAQYHPRGRRRLADLRQSAWRCSRRNHPISWLMVAVRRALIAYTMRTFASR
jgi:hypothetical protein